MRDTVAVRNGRRANFFITENRFIDCYAAKVGGSGVAVYSILQRCANSETRETWISADKMAEVLDMDRSTIYRQLKQLESLRLIRSVRTGGRTIYVVLPVPPPPREAASTPLFDAIEAKPGDGHSTWAPVASAGFSCVDEIDSHHRNPSVAPMQPGVARVQQAGRIRENHNKEEQDSSNKTQELDFSFKTSEEQNVELQEAVQRILNIFPEAPKNAALAAARVESKGAGFSAQGVVTMVWEKVTKADHRRVSREIFWNDYLSQWLGERILDEINLPPTDNLTRVVVAALKAEAKDRRLGLEETSELIVAAANEDRHRGVTIDRFYFENCKWRSNVRASKAEQRKNDNLEVNARAKQRLREKLGIL
jgi:hypothetical protein